MHPAFSVIFFTTACGVGYGIWIWLGLLALGDALPARMPTLLALMIGFVLVSAGLLSSTLHLGRPSRIWRALSQWRSSWLSREGILALACYLPMLWMLACVWGGTDARIAAVALMLLSLATVACTAMIYASLKPIAAWRHPLVLPVYLAFALLTGGLALAAVCALQGEWISSMVGAAVALAATTLWQMKRISWIAIDRGELPASRNSALGLAANRRATVFERPHTEANYLTREMGFVLARKHAHKLRTLAGILFALIPVLCALPLWIFPHFDAAPLLLVAAISALLGALVERWLFFAEARHVVMQYY